MTPHARTTDPATSHQAAATVDLPRQQALALEAIRRASRICPDGVTVSEAQTLHPAPRMPERACLARRVTDLVRQGLVTDTGRTRMAVTGRNQTVWQLTDTGRQRATVSQPELGGPDLDDAA